MSKVGEIAARIAREEGSIPAAVQPVGSKKSKLPTRKVGSGLIAGLVAALGAWVTDRYGIELGPEVYALATAGIASAVAYIVPERS